MKRVLAGCGCGLLAVAVLCGAASASTLVRSGTELVLAGDGAPNQLQVRSVSRDEAWFLAVSETLPVPPGCHAPDTSGVVICDTAGVTAIRLEGGDANDRLTALDASSGGSDPSGITVFLDGGAGDDTLEAQLLREPVVVDGGEGDDRSGGSMESRLGLTFRGGPGNDTIGATGSTAPGPWVLDGGDGNDNITAHGARWKLTGGAGDDTLDYVVGSATLSCGAGADTVWFRGGHDPRRLGQDCGPYLSLGFGILRGTYSRARQVLRLRLGRIDAPAILSLQIRDPRTFKLLRRITLRLHTGPVRVSVHASGRLAAVLRRLHPVLQVVGRTHARVAAGGDVGRFGGEVLIRRR
jgi:hypothetical protein